MEIVKLVKVSDIGKMESLAAPVISKMHKI